MKCEVKKLEDLLKTVMKQNDSFKSQIEKMTSDHSIEVEKLNDKIHESRNSLHVENQRSFVSVNENLIKRYENIRLKTICCIFNEKNLSPEMMSLTQKLLIDIYQDLDGTDIIDESIID